MSMLFFLALNISSGSQQIAKNIYFTLMFMVLGELYVSFRMVLRDIESANKSFDILMNHFRVFINFHISSDLALQLHSAT